MFEHVISSHAIGGPEPIVVEAVIENLQDLWRVRRGEIPIGQVRRLQLTEASVDGGAVALSLPSSMIRHLGLRKFARRRAGEYRAFGESGMYAPVRLTIEGRDCTVDVLEVLDGAPVLIGVTALRMLDLVHDRRARQLIGNPAHGGEHIVGMD